MLIFIISKEFIWVNEIIIVTIIRFVPKYLDQTLVNFSVSPVGDWQTESLWWELAQSRFHVDLKWNFALKNNSMEFLPGQITRQMNVLYKSQLKWVWHHSELVVEKVSFFRRLRVVLLQLYINTRWGSQCDGLWCHAPVVRLPVG